MGKAFYKKGHDGKTMSLTEFTWQGGGANLKKWIFGACFPACYGRAQKKVQAKLETPLIVELNERVTKKLWQVLTKRKPSDKDLAGLVQAKDLSHMEVLGKHPWLLPYLSMVMAGPQKAVNWFTKKEYTTVFQGEGEAQRLVYTSFNDKRTLFILPSKIAIFFVNARSNGKVEFNPKSLGQIKIDMTRDASYSLAGLYPDREDLYQKALPFQQQHLFPN